MKLTKYRLSVRVGGGGFCLRNVLDGRLNDVENNQYNYCSTLSVCMGIKRDADKERNREPSSNLIMRKIQRIKTTSRQQTYKQTNNIIPGFSTHHLNNSKIECNQPEVKF